MNLAKSRAGLSRATSFPSLLLLIAKRDLGAVIPQSSAHR
jgi:hypothetical protein